MEHIINTQPSESELDAAVAEVYASGPPYLASRIFVHVLNQRGIAAKGCAYCNESGIDPAKRPANPRQAIPIPESNCPRCGGHAFVVGDAV